MHNDEEGSLSHGIQAVLKDWITFLQRRNASEHTTRAYIIDVRGFLYFLGEHQGEPFEHLSDLSQLTIHPLRSWLSYRHSQKYNMRSTARALSAVKMFFNFLLYEHGLRPPEALKSVGRVKRTRLLPKPLSEDQVHSFLSDLPKINQETWVGKRDVALFSLIYSVGLRISEALNLAQRDIAQGSYILVLGKGQKQRYVPFLDVVIKVVGEYLAHQPFMCGPDQPLFFGIRGERLTAEVARRQIQRFREAYGFPRTFSPHTLRHSCATHLLATSHNLRIIQDLLGHTSLKATQIYTEIGQNTIFEAYNTFHPRST